MKSLDRYTVKEEAKFEFRVPDGFGNWCYPDWNEKHRAEFYDFNGALRFTATPTSDPALTQGDDYDQTNNSEGGAYVSVEGIDLTDFALGVCKAKVYAEVGGVAVLPYPTVMTAFEVVATELEKENDNEFN